MCLSRVPTLWDILDCSPPGSSVHGFFRQEYLEYVAISSSRVMLLKLLKINFLKPKLWYDVRIIFSDVWYIFILILLQKGITNFTKPKFMKEFKINWSYLEARSCERIQKYPNFPNPFSCQGAHWILEHLSR